MSPQRFATNTHLPSAALSVNDKPKARRQALAALEKALLAGRARPTLLAAHARQAPRRDRVRVAREDDRGRQNVVGAHHCRQGAQAAHLRQGARDAAVEAREDRRRRRPQGRGDMLTRAGLVPGWPGDDRQPGATLQELPGPGSSRGPSVSR